MCLNFERWSMIEISFVSVFIVVPPNYWSIEKIVACKFPWWLCHPLEIVQHLKTIKILSSSGSDKMVTNLKSPEYQQGNLRLLMDWKRIPRAKYYVFKTNLKSISALFTWSSPKIRRTASTDKLPCKHDLQREMSNCLMAKEKKLLSTSNEPHQRSFLTEFGFEKISIFFRQLFVELLARREKN